MDERAWLARYLAFGVMLVGGMEWLLGRVISRLAAVPPIEGVARTIIEVLSRVGFFVLSIAFLLAVALLVLSALQLGERAYRRRGIGDAGLALYLCIFGVFTLSGTLLALITSGEQVWLNVTFNILSAVAVWWLTMRYAMGEASLAARGAVLLLAVAYTGWYWAVLFSIQGVPGNDSFLDRPIDSLLFGELAAVFVPVVFFVAIALPGGRWRHPRRWIAPAIAGLLFSASNVADIIADQGFTGVFSIWSVGFTLYLPWPIYVISLILYLYTLLTCFVKEAGERAWYGDANVGMGLLLLPFAGYYLQLTYQHLLAVLALLLLTRMARPLAIARPARRSEIAERATI